MANKYEIIGKIEFARKLVEKSKMTSGNAYRITIRYKGREESFMFHDNVYCRSGLEDWLQAFIMDMNAYDFTQDTNAFMQEYGYEDMKQAKKVRYACYVTSKKLHRLFTEEELDILSSIE